MRRLLLVLGIFASLPALADSEGIAAALTPQYKTECGSCHVAFPPGLLNKADWQKTMARLDKHFGTDASVDAKAHQSILGYLERNAGSRNAPQAAAEPRITATNWFKKEHREVPGSVWKDSRVKTAANCVACHSGAEQGRYGESEIAVPGMQRRHEEN
jgi:nitrate/TMAO reductase-like tetraheme cytochrome c subunit